MNSIPSGTYTIQMPHRDVIIYCGDNFEVSFEVEINNKESVLWVQSAKCIKGGKTNFEEEIKKIEQWLRQKFPNRDVVLDES